MLAEKHKQDVLGGWRRGQAAGRCAGWERSPRSPTNHQHRVFPGDVRGHDPASPPARTPGFGATKGWGRWDCAWAGNYPGGLAGERLRGVFRDLRCFGLLFSWPGFVFFCVLIAGGPWRGRDRGQAGGGPDRIPGRFLGGTGRDGNSTSHPTQVWVHQFPLSSRWGTGIDWFARDHKENQTHTTPGTRLTSLPGNPPARMASHQAQGQILPSTVPGRPPISPACLLFFCECPKPWRRPILPSVA